MSSVFLILQWIFLIPAAGGSIFGLLCLPAVWRFRARLKRPNRRPFRPAATILKPVCGMEKDLAGNLRSAARQDYPEFQVVFAVQSASDPARPLLFEIQREFGPEKISVAVGNGPGRLNGKIENLLGALPHARHDILVISDSDVRLTPDYLEAVVPSLAEPEVGGACTFYRATGAERWFEKLEMLTFNADFIPSVIFAWVTGAARFCLGSSLALRRSALEEIGGLEGLADYLTEDYEIGRRLRSAGKELAIVPYFVDLVIDLKNPRQWADHQIGWEQKTRAAQPAGFLAGILLRAVPFALFFALLRLGDGAGLAVLGGVLGIRLATAGAIMGWGLGDREGLKSLWLLPLRDLAALFFWAAALAKRRVKWRGREFLLVRGGRLASPEGF